MSAVTSSALDDGSPYVHFALRATPNVRQANKMSRWRVQPLSRGSRRRCQRGNFGLGLDKAARVSRLQYRSQREDRVLTRYMSPARLGGLVSRVGDGGRCAIGWSVIGTVIGALRVRLVAVAMLVLVVGGGVAAGTTSAASGPTKVLRYGIPASNVSTGLSNPAAQQGTDGPVLSIAYASLFHIASNGSIVPGLAVSWHYAGGNSVFEFTLRHNARFSDGTPVTAAAVVSWLNYYYKSKNVFSAQLGTNPKFQALNEWTVRVKLAAPNPGLPYLFSEANVNWGFVASPKAVANPKLMQNETYGAGPYMLDPSKSVPGDHYTFVPNPYYYDKSAIRFKQVYVKAFSDSSSELEAQKAGQIDVEWTTDASTATAAASAGLHVVSAPFAVYYVALNARTGPKPLANVRVRQAMNYAINRKAIASALYGKYAIGTSQFTIPPDADPGLENYYQYSPAKAKSLLQEAGYPNGFPFTIDAFSDSVKMAQLLAANLDQVGIKTKVVTFPNVGAYLSAALSKKNVSAIFAADVGTPTPIEYPTFIQPGAQLAFVNPVNPTVNRLYEAGLRASNPSSDWKRMWGITVKDAWFIPIAATSDLVYTTSAIGGAHMTARYPYSLPTEWYFK